MRRSIFNGALIGAAFSTIGIVRQTVAGPRDWKLILNWVSWGISVAVAVGTVVEDVQALKAAEAEDPA